MIGATPLCLLCLPDLAISKLSHGPRAGLGEVLKAEHQRWSHSKSPENIDFSMRRYVFLLPSIFPQLGTGNLAEAVPERKEDSGKAQAACVRGTQLVRAGGGRLVCRLKT